MKEPETESAVGSTRMLEPCPCTSWARDGSGPLTNHHRRCDHYNDSLIDVWRCEIDGRYCYVDNEPDASACDEGVTVTRERMHREVFDNLPEFDGF